MERSEVDLNNCDREPIQFAGHIQDHGYLIALDPTTLLVTHASANAAELFGKEQLLGLGPADLDQAFQGDPQGGLLRDLIGFARRNGNYTNNNPTHARIAGMDVDLVLHHNGRRIIVEFERRDQPDGTLNVQGLLGDTMLSMQRSVDIPALLQRVAEQVKELIGFDRVMVYRFWEDWHGEVVAEAKVDHLEPYLGLHYPATDIPVQARRLYEINPTRLIRAIRSEVVPLLSREKDPLDLTHAQLRAVSPIHLEYLGNMGVNASFSISILNKGRLWGLIACHHYEGPRFIDFASRAACNLIAQFLSATIELKAEEEMRQREVRFRTANAQLKEQLFTQMDVIEGLIGRRTSLLEITDAHGAALCFGGVIHLVGQTPTREQVQQIREWLMRRDPDAVFQTSNLSAVLPSAADYADVASGLLCATLSNEMGEFVLWFKPELVQIVDWAGKPGKLESRTDDGGVRLSPRKSFEKWSQEVHATSAPWKPAEVSAVVALRDSITSLLNNKANEIRRLNEKLRIAYSELDTFSFSISHDLKTPLNTVRGYLELYLEEAGEVAPEHRGLLEQAMVNTDRMLSMIKDILEYSKVGRMEMEMESIELHALLKEALAQIRSARNTDGVRMEVPAGLNLHGKRTLVQQVLCNVLDNAVKYSRKAARPEVVVRAYPEGTDLVVECKDNGIGMDPMHAHKAFDLFQRLDNVSGFEGTGVGLAIVKRAMERHEGRIQIDSDLNKGTCVRLYFPAHDHGNQG
ncbi:MAG TPA: ATP-binding protein [Flavobacteriales bacterium]